MQWVLIRRLQAAIATQDGDCVDLSGRLTWPYRLAQEADQVIGRLESFGFGAARHLNLIRAEGGWYRRSTLAQDFALLGLGGQHSPSARATHAVAWLRSKVSDASFGSYDSSDLVGAVAEWLRPAQGRIDDLASATPHQRLARLCEVLLCAATRGAVLAGKGDLTAVRIDRASGTELLRQIKRYENDSAAAGLASVNRLVPKVHVLVRSNWTSPLRWFFLPTAERTSQDSDVRVESGLVLLLEDDIRTLPYQQTVNGSDARDPILQRLSTIAPILRTVAEIEEGHVREELMSARALWGADRVAFDSLKHTTGTIRKYLSNLGTDGARLISRLLAHLELLFVTLPDDAMPGVMRAQVSGTAAIDVGQAAVEVVEDFRAYCRLEKKGVEPEAIVTAGARAEVRPLEDLYQQEGDESFGRRAQASLELLILDLLIQRLSVGVPRIEVRVAAPDDDESLIRLQVVTPAHFRVDQLWYSPPDTLERWPRQRGFYSTFSIAAAIGATRMQVHNTPLGGAISLDFKRGGS